MILHILCVKFLNYSNLKYKGKTMKYLVIIFVFVSSSSFAVSLQNKDSKSYDIKVKGSSSTMSTSISGGTTKGSICSSSCKIIVDGVGEIEASGSDKVIIKNGSLSK